jgi:hypothetical protein
VIRWVLCLALALPCLGYAQGQARFALVIGANAGEPDEVRLRFAEDDAAEVAEVLSRLGGVPEENLTLLRGRDARRVQTVLGHLKARIAAEQAAGRETVLFAYYSGHADSAALHLGSSRLEFKTLKAAIEATGAQVSVLVVDACRSGALTRVKGAAPAEPFQIQADDRLESAGTAIITSSAAGEDSQESDRLAGGIFTHHLVTGLRGAADAAQDGTVSLSEVYQYAYRETLRTTSRARFVQHPTYAFRLSGRQDLVVTTLDDTAGLARVRLTGAGGWVLLPQGGGEVVELSADDAVKLLIRPDRYAVRWRTTDAIYEGSLDARPGATAVVDPATLTPVPYGLTVRKGLSDSPAWGPLVATEVTGPLRNQLSAGLRTAVGARLDTRQLALEARLHWTLADAQNESLQLDQNAWGIDLTGTHIFDWGPIGLGVGLRIGADLVQQRFETVGEAPDRLGVVGRAGPLVRVETAPLPWLSLGLWAGADAVAQRASRGQVQWSAQPFAGLGAWLYVP